MKCAVFIQVAMQLVLGLLLTTVFGSRDAAEPGDGLQISPAKRACDRLIAAGELLPDFPGMIAHGIHSMNQEALEILFDANATIDNGVPVVNPFLTSDRPILGSAPRLGVNMTFKTFPMNQIDWVLSHMDDQHYDMGSYNTLERLIHTMHMIEVWTEAAEIYKTLGLAPPSPDFCSCVTDVENNGVVKLLRFIALQIREPELMLGHHTLINGRTAKWDGQLYKYFFLTGKTATGDVLDKADVLPKLTSPQAWQTWKDTMASMKGHGGLVVAKYLHCALHPSIVPDVAQDRS